MFERILKWLLSVGAISAVIWLAYYSSTTGNEISPRAYAILGGAVFWASSDDFLEILSFFRKWPSMSSKKSG